MKMEATPLLTYGNLLAQRFFAMDWSTLIQTPSRETAEAPERKERDERLKRVSEHGFIDDYSGIRISGDGRRFMIRNAIVWKVTDLSGNKTGQAAAFSEWEFIGEYRRHGFWPAAIPGFP